MSSSLKNTYKEKKVSGAAGLVVWKQKRDVALSTAPYNHSTSQLRHHFLNKELGEEKRGHGTEKLDSYSRVEADIIDNLSLDLKRCD